MNQLGALWPVSDYTLGGGGIGQVWGSTDRAEAVATVQAAVDHGITLLDLAPLYGRGEAERVVGAAFNGSLPDGIRVTSKCLLATDTHRGHCRSLGKIHPAQLRQPKGRAH